MTSVSGAGYQSKKQGTFDPLNQGHGPAPALAEKADNGPEDMAKEIERQVLVHSLGSIFGSELCPLFALVGPTQTAMTPILSRVKSIFV